jgi:hypothetical protein
MLVSLLELCRSCLVQVVQVLVEDGRLRSGATCDRLGFKGKKQAAAV